MEVDYISDKLVLHQINLPNWFRVLIKSSLVLRPDEEVDVATGLIVSTVVTSALVSELSVLSSLVE